ncbi:helix-turn-helix transcriptional regulator|uniref:helix-turn-helix domain-containing protein n=1 Tax=Dendrosporobacter quercicolus TaxID=146817 RepID=UPI00156F56B6|nr:AraC family transcriptional regulator [Dendrosporobacter quercicolus]NSL48590.1 helix-turn-helix transcriptional regulator [Dendrosporobacter quercicolus DSM 1736]
MVHHKLTEAQFDHLLNQTSHDLRYDFPQQIASGYCRQIRPDETLQVVQFSACFHDTLQVPVALRRKVCQLAFCCDGPITWETAGGGEAVLLQGESCFSHGEQMDGINRYFRDTKYSGLVINLEQGRFQAVFEAFRSGRGSSRPGGRKPPVKPITPAVRKLLGEIRSGSGEDALQRLYLEAKILELVAVYVNEMAEEQQPGAGAVKLSAADIAGLRQIKLILDEQTDMAPTIRVLARLTCLNEYKIKTGFKQLFGLPVHSYVVDKRMEKARELLEGGRLKVGEIAARVGYTNTSHFIAAFRKKFGVNPGEYANGGRF